MANRAFRRVSLRQLELLYDFLHKNPAVAKSFNRSLQAKDWAKRKWKEAAEILNAQGEGTYKDWRGWCKYWIDYKAKIKARVAAIKASQMENGEGADFTKPLSEIDEKFLSILGRDFGQVNLASTKAELILERRGVMTQQYTRRALVASSQRRAKASERSAGVLEKIADALVGIQSSLIRVERSLAAAFPMADEPIRQIKTETD